MLFIRTDHPVPIQFTQPAQIVAGGRIIPGKPVHFAQELKHHTQLTPLLPRLRDVRDMTGVCVDSVTVEQSPGDKVSLGYHCAVAYKEEGHCDLFIGENTLLSGGLLTPLGEKTLLHEAGHAAQRHGIQNEFLQCALAIDDHIRDVPDTTRLRRAIVKTFQSITCYSRRLHEVDSVLKALAPILKQLPLHSAEAAFTKLQEEPSLEKALDAAFPEDSTLRAATDLVQKLESKPIWRQLTSPSAPVPTSLSTETEIPLPGRLPHATVRLRMFVNLKEKLDEFRADHYAVIHGACEPSFERYMYKLSKEYAKEAVQFGLSRKAYAEHVSESHPDPKTRGHFIQAARIKRKRLESESDAPYPPFARG